MVRLQSRAYVTNRAIPAKPHAPTHVSRSRILFLCVFIILKRVNVAIPFGFEFIVGGRFIGIFFALSIFFFRIEGHVGARIAIDDGRFALFSLFFVHEFCGLLNPDLKKLYPDAEGTAILESYLRRFSPFEESVAAGLGAMV